MDLSIIILNYNTFSLTKGCIESIKKHVKDLKCEVIVVDNASSSKEIVSLENFVKGIDNLKLIKNKTNDGFAKGNNIGIKKASGEFVLLLNSDTVFTKNIMSELITWMKSHSNVGVASVALLSPDGKTQRNGGYFPNLLRVFMWMSFIEDIPYFDRIVKMFHPLPSRWPRQQDWVTGAFMLIPKKAIDQAGLMPEDYFMYTEDVDYCYSFKNHNWQVWYLPKWSIIHFGGASSEAGSGIVREFTSLEIFFRKHYPTWQLGFMRFFMRIGAILRMIVLAILGKPSKAKLYAEILTG